MDEESKGTGSSGRASSETVADNASQDRTFEKISLTGEDSTMSARPFWRRHLVAFCVHGVVFLTYTIIAMLASESSSKSVQSDRPFLWSPANEILEWNLHEFHSGDGLTGVYSGYPRPELEEAWDNLLNNMNIRLSREDLKAFGREEDAVELPDGSGYAGTLNIYHEVHCVRWMHKYMYQEYYYPGLDDAQREANRLHSEHCLNHLRKSAMCHGDVGLITYQWVNDSLKPYSSATKHQCIEWEPLAEWTRQRTVNLFQPYYLIHPTLGPLYRDGDTKDPMD